MAYRKIAVSLPEELVLSLDYVAKRMNITRSALLSEISSEPAHDLKSLFDGLPENPTKEDILRSRGQSIELINQRMASARRMKDDLFS